MTPNEHLQVAYHEAGHAIERFLLDYEVVTVYYDFDAGVGACEYVDSEDDVIDHEDEICCLLAGPVAQSMFMGSVGA